MPSERWRLIKNIFTSTAEIPPDQRDALLDVACADDPSLRHEVEALLKAHDSANSFIELPAVRRSGLAHAATNWIGRRFGPYRVVAEVDRGGMSEVYRAIRDDNQYEKEVAIKLLRNGFDSESLLRHLREERQILAQLSHPHIAHLLDGGTTEEGMPYLVMEYIQGQPIDVYCEQRQLGLRERLELIRTLCGAVVYVHQHLMVHGDLKCSNVLVTDKGVLKLLDFGIAKLLNPTPALTAADPEVSGFLALTPDYASPEQLRGEPITTASDVYSMGVLMYRLLAGRLPFAPRHMVSREQAMEICELQPAAPSATAASFDESYRRFARSLEGELDSIILKGLRKSPQERYGSVEQLSEDVHRYLCGLPVGAYGGGPAYLAKKFVRRHRAVTAAMSMFVIALLLGVVATSWQAHVAEAERARAERHFDNVRRFAISYMTEVHAAIENLPGSTSARKLLVETSLRHLTELAKEAGDNPILRRDLADAYEKIGDLQGRLRGANLGDTKAAIQSYELALRTREALIEEGGHIDLQRDLLRTHGKLAELLVIQNEPDQATEHLRDVMRLANALAAMPAATAADRRNLATSYLALGWHRAALGHIDEGTALMADALPLFQQIVAADPSDQRARRNFAITHQRIGGILVERTGRYEEAARYLSRSIELLDELRQPDPQNADLRRVHAYALIWMGDALLGQGRAQEALSMHQRGYEVFEAIRTADPADFEAPIAAGYASSQMSQSLMALDLAPRALEQLSHAEKGLRNRAKGVDDELPESYYYIGLLYFHLGKVNAYLAAKQDVARSARERHARQAREWLRKSNEAMKHAVTDAVHGVRARERIAEAETLIRSLATSQPIS
jgi:non-specific serine/threonine protein kinase/serine/threonine-protein kinase